MMFIPVKIINLYAIKTIGLITSVDIDAHIDKLRQQ
jgi:hypothetical protein